MKFIAKTGAPDIPLPLLEAQESGRLALFCGAGISYPAGLPGFKGLVDLIYDRLGTAPEPLEEAAKRQHLYDRVLELLERRHHTGNDRPNLMRVLLTDLLKIKEDADVQTHRALLQIATGPTGSRHLVTTNFDHGFLLADPNSTGHTHHAAPRLPVPKPHKWNSIVYLHGLLDPEEDPGNNSLVFTSGDFGAAYLTERWASKFVTELFANYTVVFVGYSIDDPVIRYMTDAIAADRRLGFNETQHAYVIARTTPSKYLADKDAWAAKGVQPILYHSDRKHGHLHQTLRQWAAYCKDGLNAKEQIIRTQATIVPLPPYEGVEAVGQVLDILRERESLTDSVTGYPAQVFASLDDPPAPIEWLPVLESKGLLARSVVPGLVRPVHSSHEIGLYSKPNQISSQIWKWLCHHLGSRRLVNWVIEQGTCLHPDFASVVNRHLMGPEAPAEPFYSFWKAIVVGLVDCRHDDAYGGFSDIKDAVSAGNPLALRALLGMLKAHLSFEKSFDLEEIYSDLGEHAPEHAPFSVKVSIRLSEWEFQELTELGTYPDVLIDLLPEITSHLFDAMQLLAVFGKANRESDNSYWGMPSIEPHNQNHRFHNWVFLIEMCRDIWLKAWDRSSPIAQATFSQWKTSQFPIFRRLLLHAATHRQILDPDSALDLLLTDDKWWLWSIEVQREKYRFLAAMWPRLSVDASTALEQAILQGPPRRMFSTSLSDEEWRGRKMHDLWQHLSKLQSFGRELSPQSAEELRKLSADNPQWSLHGDDREEFAMWSESSVGNPMDVTVEVLQKMPVAERVALLQDENSEFHEGRIDAFRQFSQEHPGETLETLTYMADEHVWAAKLWHAAIMGVANSIEPYQPQLFHLLTQADETLLRQEAWVIAYWLREAGSEIESESDLEAVYWDLFDRLYQHALMKETDVDTDALNTAINHPVGILVESLIDRLGSRGLTRDAGLSDESIVHRLEHVLAQHTDSGLLGLVILFSRLQYLHVVDPRWCRTNLLGYMDWTEPRISRACWSGYLWASRVTIGLATDIASPLLETLKHTDLLQKQSARAVEMFGVICLEFPDVFSARDISTGLASCGKEGYANVSKLIWRSLRVETAGVDDGEIALSRAARDNYWNGRVAPFIAQHWSRDVQYISDERTTNLVLSVLQLNSTFSEAVTLIRPFLGPISRPGHIFRTAHDKEWLIQKYPKEVFSLVDEVFSELWEYPDKNFRQLLHLLVQAEPEVGKNNQRYRQIDQFLVTHGL